MEMHLVTNNPVFMNKELHKATILIMKMSDQIKQRQFDIASVLADIDMRELYTDDGFTSTVEYAMHTFGMQKSLAYQLVTIGREYTRNVLSDEGKAIGHASNLVPPANNEKQDAPITDFTTAQIGKLLPLGRERILEGIESGELKPSMTHREIESYVKRYRPPKSLPTPDVENESRDTIETHTDHTESVTESPKPLVINTVRGDGFDNISTDILIAELRLRGYQVYRDGREQLIDWKGEGDK